MTEVLVLCLVWQGRLSGEVGVRNEGDVAVGFSVSGDLVCEVVCAAMEE